jgi:hypothetical protein
MCHRPSRPGRGFRVSRSELCDFRYDTSTRLIYTYVYIYIHIITYIYIYISLETPPIPPKIFLSFPQTTHFSSSPARGAGFARSDFLESPHGGDSHRCGVEVKDIGRDAIEDHEAQDHDCKVLGIFQYFLDPRV